MTQGWKTILHVIAGLLAGGITVAAVEAIGHMLVSGDTVFVFAAIGLGIGGFMGSTVTALLSKRRIPAYVVGLLLAGLSLVNVFSFEHPVWFVPVAFALLAVGVWTSAARLVKNAE